MSINESDTGRNGTQEESKTGIESAVQSACDCEKIAGEISGECNKTDVHDPGEEICRLQKDAEVLKDLLQRRQADFENYRKRTVRLQEDNKKLAIKDFAYDIININDDLLRAIEAAGILDSENVAKNESFIEGVKIISRRIEETLNKYGITEIEAVNRPFDPNLHEALEIEMSPEHDIDTVTHVYQKGFRLEDHVVRSAKVRVSKATPEAGSEDKAQQAD